MIAPTRATSIDAYRGFAMFLMLAEVLQLPNIAKQFPNSPFWKTVRFHTTHVEWVGCSLHDLIQPSFSFLVGAALAFSIARRKADGQSFGKAALHAGWRAFVLIALGIVLRSIGKPHTVFTFEDTLTQIGLGYLPLFLLAWAYPAPSSRHALAILLILGFTWVAYVGYDWNLETSTAEMTREPNPRPVPQEGFEAHWQKNDNLGWGFDHWFLNQFGRDSRFTRNRGGYATISAVPTLATMLLGLLAGGWMRSELTPWRKVGLFAAVGAGLLGAGWAIDAVGVCPMVKRIWTPSWVLFSGGWCFVLLALFHAATDAAGYRGWSYPLRVIGANSILIYCVAEVPIAAFLVGTFKTHLGADVFRIFGARSEPVVAGAAVLAVYWLVLWWLYRKKLFVRI